MARKAGKMRGDMRAMEEQHTLPQSNPVRGGSATPSMGLSQFRGGGLLGQDGHGMRRMVGSGTGGRRGCGTGGRNNKVEEAHRLGRALNLHLHKLHGSGYARAFAHGCSGGGFFDSIKDAFQKVGNEFTNPDSVLRRGATDVGQKIGHEFTDPNSVLRGQVLPEASKYASYAAPVLDVAGTAVGLPGAGTMLSRGLSAAQYANQGAKALGYGRGRRGCGTGAGKLVITHGGGRERDDVAMMRGGYDSDSDEDMEGGQSFANPTSMSMSGAYQGQGRKKRAPAGAFSVFTDRVSSTPEQLMGRQQSMANISNQRLTNANAMDKALMESRAKKGGKRAPAGPNDGRRKRAEIVKRVMAQKGMKMIEASKYVKEHGLY